MATSIGGSGPCLPPRSGSIVCRISVRKVLTWASLNSCDGPAGVRSGLSMSTASGEVRLKIPASIIELAAGVTLHTAVWAGPVAKRSGCVGE